MRKLMLMMGLLLSTALIAQTPEVPNKKVSKEQREARRAQIEEERVEFIANYLKLDEALKAKFTALYKAELLEQKGLKKASKVAKPKTKEGMTEAEAQQNIEAHLALKQQMLDIEKRYVKQYVDLIGALKTLEIPQAERAFKKQLLNEMRG